MKSLKFFLVLLVIALYSVVHVWGQCLSNFSWSTPLCGGKVVNFTNLSTGGLSNSWEFGDGSVSFAASPSHTYATGGTYTVKLKINCGGGVTHTTSKTIVVEEAPVPAISGDLELCGTSSITYTASGKPGSTFTWSITGGAPSGGAGPSISVTWIPTGGTITLTETTVTGCSGSITRTVWPCCASPGAAIVTDDGDNTSSPAFPLILVGVTISINGTLKITDLTSWVNCNVFLAPDAKIIIDNGQTLNLNNTDLKSCDGLNMWDGIYILHPSSKLNVMNTSLIRDAKNAVVSENGGNFNLTKCLFDLNYKHVIVRPFSGAHPAVIMGSKFTCSSPAAMLAPWTGKRTAVGIEIIKNADFKVGQTTGGATSNAFSWMAIGIRSQSSSLTVKNNTFQNFVPTLVAGEPVPLTGLAIHAIGELPTFLWPLRTVIVGGATPIETNSFDICHQSYEADGTLKQRIEGNSFDRGRTWQVSIYDSRVTDLDVIGNKFTRGPSGILAVKNTLSRLNIRKNDFEYTIPIVDIYGPINGLAIKVTDVAGSSTFAPTTVKIERNDIDVYGGAILATNVRGLSISDRNRIYMVPVGTPSWGSPLDPEQWAVKLEGCMSPVIGPNNVITAGSFGFVYSLRYRGIRLEMCPDALISCNAIRGFGQSLMFDGLSASAEVWNNEFNDAQYGIVLRNAAWLGVLGSPTMPTDNQWFALYGAAAHTHTLTAAIGSNIYSRSVPPSCGGSPFCPGINTTLGSIEFTPVISSGPGTLCPPVHLRLNQMENLHKVAAGAPPFAGMPAEHQYLHSQHLVNTMMEDTTLYADTLLATTAAAPCHAALCALKQVDKALAVADIPLAEAMNAAVLTGNTIEENHKIFNDIYLRIAASEPGTLDMADRSALESIAAQCPFTGGFAVYQARTLLELFLRQEVNYEGACGGVFKTAQDNNASGETQASRYFIAPNPSEEETTLYGEFKNETTVIVSTALGQEIKRLTIPANTHNFNIGLSELPAGIYLLAVQGPENIRQTLRLSVAK